MTGAALGFFFPFPFLLSPPFSLFPFSKVAPLLMEFVLWDFLKVFFFVGGVFFGEGWT